MSTWQHAKEPIRNIHTHRPTGLLVSSSNVCDSNHIGYCGIKYRMVFDLLKYSYHITKHYELLQLLYLTNVASALQNLIKILSVVLEFKHAVRRGGTLDETNECTFLF